MKYDTVIYDLDGTLLNTLDDLAAAVNVALRRLDLPERGVDEVRRMVGNGMELLIRRALPEGAQARMPEALRLFKAHYAAHAQDATRPYPGVEAMLLRLSAAGARQAIVSNKGDPFVKELNRRYFGLPVAVGEREGVRRKPCPDMLLQVMEGFGARASRTLYVGDSDVDIETARAAGVACACVTWGFRTRAQLLAAGAETLIDTPEALARLVLGT